MFCSRVFSLPLGFLQEFLSGWLPSTPADSLVTISAFMLKKQRVESSFTILPNSTLINQIGNLTKQPNVISFWFLVPGWKEENVFVLYEGFLKRYALVPYPPNKGRETVCNTGIISERSFQHSGHLNNKNIFSGTLLTLLTLGNINKVHTLKTLQHTKHFTWLSQKSSNICL